jgi:hypothetical protein
VSQPEISPLARRLAEENNVDWRDLHGSGAGGKVVERDVLEFLARVMAGEEDLDPTPEPVPEGMEAWPEEDTHSFQQQMRDSSKGVGLEEIQQELSASDRLAEGVSEPDTAPLQAVPSAYDSGADAVTDDISEDIFLFDDEEDAESTIGWPGGVSAEGSGWEGVPPETDGEPEDELLVAGEDSGGWNGGLAGDALDTEEAEALWSGSTPVGTPDSLPDVFRDEEPAPEPRQDVGGEALFDEDATLPADDGGGALEMPPLGDLDLGGAASATERFDDLRGASEEDESFAAGFQAGFGSGYEHTPEAQEPFASDGYGEEPLGATAADADDGSAAIAAEAVTNGGATPDEPPSAETGEAEATSDAWISERMFEPARTTELGAELETAAEQLSDRPVGEASAADETALPPLSGGMSAESAGTVPSELPLVSYGTLLRRHLDVTALAGAQLAVGLELGESEPLPPGPFLLRAAAKAVAEGGWGDGPVAAVGWDERGQLRVARIGGAVERPFIDLAHDLGAALSAASSDTSGVSLAVVDMSSLDVDEAVLNVDAPLLTLGRILYDNQRGSYRSTLSLAGDVPPERGARLLARVAELLDAPVRLLL